MTVEAEQWLIDVETAARAQDWPRAVAAAERALSLGAVHPRLLQVRAIGRERAGQFGGAIDDLVRARAMDPDDPGIANALGSCLTRAGRLGDAVTVLEAEVAVRPDLPESWFNLGAALFSMGDLRRAGEAFTQAVARRPTFAEALGRLAILALHRGDAAEGRAFAERALAVAPANTDARRALIEAEIEDGQAVEAEAGVRRWLQTSGLGPNARHHALGLLGDALDRQGRYPEAFAAYGASKAAFAEAQARTYRALDAHPLAGTLEAMRREFEALPKRPAIERQPGPGEPRVHVFLMGFMRSGTTLLEQALSAHPDVVALEETEAMTHAGAAYLGQPGGLAQIAAMNTGAVAANRSAYWAAVREAGIEPAGRVLVDKLPFNGVKLPLIQTLFPAARIVFAIRDPRDVVLSCFQKRLAPNGFAYEMRTLQGAARFYASYMALVRAYRAGLELAILDHRHEALVTDLEGAVRQVCAFIGIDFHPPMTTFQAAARAGAVMSQTSRQLRDGVNTKGLGRWRAYAEPMAPVLPILQPWVDAYGYDAV